MEQNTPASASTVTETLLPQTFRWRNAIVLTLLPTTAIAAAVLYTVYQGFHWQHLVHFAVMFVLCGLGVTAGYHRYYAHRAFEAHPIVEFFLLLFGTAAFQNSVLIWSSDHRYHHRFVDKDEDPYNIKKGFWWAHMGWIFWEFESGSRPYSNVDDLRKHKMVVFQDRFYLPLMLFTCFGIPFLIGLAYGMPWGGLIFGGLFRLAFTHQCTYLINSAAHWFGTQPYSTQNTARDSWWLAFLSNGEGYHNYHHVFPSDYRNGIAWYHFDPTKWLVYGLSRLGLTWGLRRTPVKTIERMKAMYGEKAVRERESVLGAPVAMPGILEESIS